MRSAMKLYPSLVNRCPMLSNTFIVQMEQVEGEGREREREREIPDLILVIRPYY